MTTLKLRYKGTILGFLWAVLEPILIFLLLYLVFTNIKADRGENFAFYLIIGVIFLHLFTHGSMAGLLSLRSNRNILKFIKIEKEFFPVANTLSTALILFIEVGIFLALMPIFGFKYETSLIFLPVIMTFFLCLVLGMSYLLSILHIYFKDIRPIWGVITYSLIFISPVFWYVENAQGILLNIYHINPIGQIIELSHKAVFGKAISLLEWSYVAALNLGILFFGFAMFKKFESKVVEKL